jgi:3D (Asp-Asp-Asp) domain-containing protein
MKRETKKLIIVALCGALLMAICLLWVSTIPEGTPGLLNKPKEIKVATMTDIATATDSEPTEEITYIERYGLEQPMVWNEVKEEEIVYIPSPVLSERKEPKLEVEIVTTEEMTTEEVVYEEPTAPSGMTYIGTYYITGYVASGNPCKDESMPVVGWTAANNDPNLWGKTIHIEGLGDRYIHDTGGMGLGTIDVFVGSVDEAYAITGNYEVYVYE